MMPAADRESVVRSPGSRPRLAISGSKTVALLAGKRSAAAR